ncbi:MAG: enolase C-terminal domain-like protein [Lapillicoccus sp.]
MSSIAALEVIDIRFPTSRHLDGSDAMNPDPDYSAAYVVLHTDADDDLEGHGFTFTIGRGNEIVCTAIEALRPLVLGRVVEETFADMGAFWKEVTRDSQLRWIGPEKGAIHLATAAVVNAMWDLFAKRESKPLWKLLVDMTPEQVVGLVDWRYLTDVLTPAQALDMLRATETTKPHREQQLREDGIPSYTTSAGWLGYDDDKLRRLCQQAVDDGWSHIKLKVGADIDNDVRRCRIARQILGPDRRLMVDANQAWDVGEAVANMGRLAQFDPWWIEEPTSPDDILGHAAIAAAIAPCRVATGEHVHNRVMFKQLLQAEAIGFCQIDACRLGGVNEVVAVLLLAARFGVPVCPHAGGVGLCELVQHLTAFDYVAVSGSFDDVVVEYVDHLHEHFLDPVRTVASRYLVPEMPGYSAQMHRESIQAYAFPHGSEWARA